MRKLAIASAQLLLIVAALDETPGGGTDDALFNVLRLRRDAGRNSLVGLTLTDRRAGGLANTVAAADARIVFGKYYVAAGVAGTTSHAAHASRPAAMPI